MIEQGYIPAESDIFSAERQRTSGRTQDAVEIVKPAVEYPYDNFASLALSEKQRLLMASRIFVVGENSLARRSWNPSSVVDHLREARRGIVDVYRNPQVKAEVGNISSDTRGNPYEFITEMSRDEISYTLTLATFTGNTKLLDSLVDKLGEVIVKAEEPTAKTLAIFEQERLFHSHYNEQFSHFKDAYEEAAEASSEIGRWERVSTISSKFFIDAIKESHLISAMGAFRRIISAGIHDSSTATILYREVSKALTQGARVAYWRSIASGDADYSGLHLPRE